MTFQRNTTREFAPVAALFQTDGYKLFHLQAYEAATGGKLTRIYSNFTNRGSRIPGVSHVVHFGLQAFLERYAHEAFEPFFAADEDLVCELYERRLSSYLPGNTIGSDHVRDLHRLGYLPLEFSAVPEGTRVPIRVPSFTIENTNPQFFWLTNYIETVLSASYWQASTSATIANEYRTIVEEGAALTGASTLALDWQCHDFSYRGMSSNETAAASAAGHLLSFTGTDSLVALDWIDRYYGGEYVAGSVPATEHSVMSTGIAMADEATMFETILDIVPTGIVSVVSDTFDLWNVLTNILPSMKERILGRDGKLVIRPDSGDPVDILCGTDSSSHDGARSPEQKGVIELLWDVFGGTVNEAGFKELDPHIGAIYGDSITRERAKLIIERLAAKGFASTNVVFGVGSYTYQYNTRDTFMSAVKATEAIVDGQPLNLFKDPVTDSGMKRSATGRLAVLRNAEGELYLAEKASATEQAQSLLQPVWRDGEFLTFQSFADIRTVLAQERAV